MEARASNAAHDGGGLIVGAHYTGGTTDNGADDPGNPADLVSGGVGDYGPDDGADQGSDGGSDECFGVHAVFPSSHSGYQVRAPTPHQNHYFN